MSLARKCLWKIIWYYQLLLSLVWKNKIIILSSFNVKKKPSQTRLWFLFDHRDLCKKILKMCVNRRKNSKRGRCFEYRLSLLAIFSYKLLNYPYIQFRIPFKWFFFEISPPDFSRNHPKSTTHWPLLYTVVYDTGGIQLHVHVNYNLRWSERYTLHRSNVHILSTNM